MPKYTVITQQIIQKTWEVEAANESAALRAIKDLPPDNQTDTAERIFEVSVVRGGE